MDTSVAAADTTSDSQYGPSAKRLKLEGKPIGIAQPFRQQELATDSDQDSIDTRFDRFQNESNIKKVHRCTYMYMYVPINEQC